MTIEDTKELAESYDSMVENVTDKISTLKESLNDIFGEFNDTESQERQKVGEAIVESEENIQKLKEQLRNEEDMKKAMQLEQELSRELDAREQLKERIAGFEEEVTEIKRVNSLSQLQLAFENFDKEIEKAKELKNERLKAFDEELAKAEETFPELKELWQERNAKIMELLKNEQGDTDLLNDKMRETNETVRALISSLNELQRMRAQGMSDGGVVQGFSDGGVVKTLYAQSGAFVPKGTDTVPAMLTPGEVVLNAAQQKNVASNLGGVTINITGTFGSDAADELGDAIVRKLQLVASR
jgi:chromosome segregation ATPase